MSDNNSGRTGVWHYTTLDRLLMIVRDGTINPAVAHLSQHEKPVTWFSSNRTWEPTASKGVAVAGGLTRTLGLDEMVVRTGGLARIELDTERLNPIPWLRLIGAARIPRKVAETLARTGKRDGARPRNWHGIIGPVSKDHWLRVEVATDADPIVWSPWETKNEAVAARDQEKGRGVNPDAAGGRDSD